MYSDHGDEWYVSVLISIGGKDVPVSERCAFYVRIYISDERWTVRVYGSADSPFVGVEEFGTILDREEALAHPLIKEVFHITDHIVVEDEPVIARLYGGLP